MNRLSHPFSRACALLLSVLLLSALVLPARPTAAQSPQKTFTLRQWASNATATSEFRQESWDALQAAGQPDTFTCSDQASAWASATPNGQDALTVLFDVPVIPSEVNIYQTFSPGAITGIALIPADGSEAIPVPNSADPGTECPGVFSVPITGGLYTVNGVIITLDQTITGTWNEIDAVELVGQAMPGAEVALWASQAMATSAYGSTAWDPLQATSAPDVAECGDNARAWASSTASGQDTLAVFFPAAVIASRLDIHQTSGPGAITAVDLILADYSRVPVPNSADPGTDCPGIFSLAISETAPIIGAAIQLDQTLVEWNEIDAVQATGVLAAQDAQTVAQWASDASATSEYGSENWSALQATGMPDSLVCGDQATAWAAASSTSTESLILFFDQPVIPAAVNIFQSYNPGAIAGVELVLADGSGYFPIPDSADPGTPCPGVFSLAITDVTSPVNGVVLHLDQARTGDWNEIDAVQLIGTPAQ